MSTIALPAAELRDAPKLRLLPSKSSLRATSTAFVGSARGTDHDSAEQRPALRPVDDAPLQERPVLIAGGDARRREAVRKDLACSMPPETAFEEAGAFWEVLVRAPKTSMVILSGELDDVPAESLFAMLAHRHPELPVVSLDARAELAEARSQA